MSDPAIHPGPVYGAQGWAQLITPAAPWQTCCRNKLKHGIPPVKRGHETVTGACLDVSLIWRDRVIPRFILAKDGFFCGPE